MDNESSNEGYQNIMQIGEGAFSTVYKAKSSRDGQIYAIKYLKRRYSTIEEINQINEIVHLRMLQDHPNIIKLIEVLHNSEFRALAIVFEFMDLNLYELLEENRQPFSEKISLLLIYQLLRAVKALHSKGIFHRDIKPENCMVKKDTYELKLADFGSTRQVNECTPYTEYIATRWYRAPECILTAGSYGPPVDIWAVGCVLFELLSGRPLFPGSNQLDQIGQIHQIVGTPSPSLLSTFTSNPSHVLSIESNPQLSFIFPQYPPQKFKKLLPNTSDQIIDMIMKMIVYNPEERMTVLECLNHPALKDYRKVDLIYGRSRKNCSYAAFFNSYNSSSSIDSDFINNPPMLEPFS